jgi:hypothetical protein
MLSYISDLYNCLIKLTNLMYLTKCT